MALSAAAQLGPSLGERFAANAMARGEGSVKAKALVPRRVSNGLCPLTWLR